MSDIENALNRQAEKGENAPPPFSPNLGKEDEVFELGNDFDLDSFQVVRREFFAHLNEPSITFNRGKVYVNTACLSKFPTVDYVQLLINREKRVLCLRPCPDSTRDSFPWSTLSKGKRKPKQTTGRLFTAMLFDMMEWNPDYRYKILGKVVYAHGEYLVAFDLTATEVYQCIFAEGEKPKVSRRPVFPAHWQTQFGLPLKEHKKSLQVNLFSGYTIFSVKDTDVSESRSLEDTAILPSSMALVDNPLYSPQTNQTGGIQHEN